MEELKSAIYEHVDLLSDLLDKLRAEIKSGSQPAIENFIGFFHAINWKETWLISLLLFYAFLLAIVILFRKNTNFQMTLFFLALAGVYLAEVINGILGNNWKKFSTQNYFDSSGLFLSVLWSGPLLVIAMIILVNSFFSLCYLIVRWKKAELKHRARLNHSNQELNHSKHD